MSPRNNSGRVVALILTCGLVSCVGLCRDADGPTEDDSEFCSEISLAETSAEPLDRIALGITADETPATLVGVVTAASVPEPYYTPVIPDDEGELYVLVPLHPDGIEGGEVTLAFSSDDADCAGTELEVEPLPEAPGSYEELVAETARNVELLAATMGRTPEELVSAEPDQLPLSLWGAAMAQGMLDASDNNSLLAAADGTAPRLESREVDMELVDAVVAKSGLLDQARATTAALEDLGEPPMEPTFETVPVGAAPPGGLASSALKIDIGNPATLSYYMKVADAEWRAANSEALSTATTVASWASLFPHPAIKGASLILGLALFVRQKMGEVASNVLPSVVEGIEVAANPTSFNEDFMQTGMWSDYRVVAKSKAWTADRLIIESLLEAVFAAKGFKEYDAFQTRYLKSEQLIEAGEWYHENHVVKRYVPQASQDVVDVGPFEWGPFDLTDLAWSRAGIVDSAIHGLAIRLNPDDVHEYIPTRVGTGAFRVYADPAQFPPASNEFSSELIVDVEVKEILIFLHPEAKVVVPGETVEITSTIHHAHDRKLRWETSVGTLDVAQDGQSAILEVPDREVGLINVTAHSRALTGLRDPVLDPPPRFGTALYSAEEKIEITPGGACVRPGERLDFDARVYLADANQDVEWSTDYGTMLDRGVYEAPDSPGEAFVTVTSVSNPDLQASAHVTVGPCKCRWRATVAGKWSGFGPQAAATVAGVEFENEPTDEHGFLGCNTENWADSVGVYDECWFTGGPENIILVGGTDPEAGTFMRTTVSESGDEFVEGSVDGLVHDANELSRENPPTYRLQFQFRAAKVDLADPNFDEKCR